MPSRQPGCPSERPRPICSCFSKRAVGTTFLHCSTWLRFLSAAAHVRRAACGSPPNINGELAPFPVKYGLLAQGGAPNTMSAAETRAVGLPNNHSPLRRGRRLLGCGWLFGGRLDYAFNKAGSGGDRRRLFAKVRWKLDTPRLYSGI